MIAELFQGIADVLFGSNGIPETALIKLGLFIILFFGIFKGAEKIFSDNPAIPLLIAAVISLIGVRMIPEEIQLAMGTVLAGILFFFGPYFLISVITDALRLGRTVKWIFVVIAYSALIYLLPSIAIPAYGSDALDSLFGYMADYQMVTWGVFIGILTVLILARRRMYGGVRGGAGLFRRGLGGGAGLLRGGLRAVGRAGIGAANNVANMGRYVGQGAAFGAGAAGAYTAGRAGGWLQRRRAMQQAQQQAAQRSAPQQAQPGMFERRLESIRGRQQASGMTRPKALVSSYKQTGAYQQRLAQMRAQQTMQQNTPRQTQQGWWARRRAARQARAQQQAAQRSAPQQAQPGMFERRLESIRGRQQASGMTRPKALVSSYKQTGAYQQRLAQMRAQQTMQQNTPRQTQQGWWARRRAARQARAQQQAAQRTMLQQPQSRPYSMRLNLIGDRSKKIDEIRAVQRNSLQQRAVDLLRRLRRKNR